MSLSDLANLSPKQAFGTFTNDGGGGSINACDTIKAVLEGAGWSDDDGSDTKASGTLWGPLGWGYAGFLGLVCEMQGKAFIFYDPSWQQCPSGNLPDGASIVGVPIGRTSAESEIALAAAIGGAVQDPATIKWTGLTGTYDDGIVISPGPGDVSVGSVTGGGGWGLQNPKQSDGKTALTGTCSDTDGGPTVTWDSGDLFDSSMVGAILTVTITDPVLPPTTLTLTVNSVASDGQSLQARTSTATSWTNCSFSCPVPGVNQAQIQVIVRTGESDGPEGVRLTFTINNTDVVDIYLAAGDWLVMASTNQVLFYTLDANPYVVHQHNTFVWACCPVIPGAQAHELTFAAFVAQINAGNLASTLGGNPYFGGGGCYVDMWTGAATPVRVTGSAGQRGWSILMSHSEGAPLTDPVGGALFTPAFLMLSGGGESGIVGYVPDTFASSLPDTFGRQISVTDSQNKSKYYRCIATQSEPPGSLWMATGEQAAAGSAAGGGFVNMTLSGTCSATVADSGPTTVTWDSGALFTAAMVGFVMEVIDASGLAVNFTVATVAADGKSLTTLDSPNFSWDNQPFWITPGVQTGFGAPVQNQPPSTRLPDKSGYVALGTSIPDVFLVVLVSGDAFDASMVGGLIAIGYPDQQMQLWQTSTVTAVMDASHLDSSAPLGGVVMVAGVTYYPYSYWAALPTLTGQKRGTIDCTAFNVNPTGPAVWVSGDKFDVSMEGKPILLGSICLVHVGTVLDDEHLSIAETDLGLRVSQFPEFGVTTYSC